MYEVPGSNPVLEIKVLATALWSLNKHQTVANNPDIHI